MSSIYPRLRLRSKVGSRYIVRPVFNKSIDEDDEVLEIDIVKRIEIEYISHIINYFWNWV